MREGFGVLDLELGHRPIQRVVEQFGQVILNTVTVLSCHADFWPAMRRRHDDLMIGRAIIVSVLHVMELGEDHHARCIAFVEDKLNLTIQSAAARQFGLELGKVVKPPLAPFVVTRLFAIAHRLQCFAESTKDGPVLRAHCCIPVAR